MAEEAAPLHLVLPSCRRGAADSKMHPRELVNCRPSPIALEALGGIRLQLLAFRPNKAAF